MAPDVSRRAAAALTGGHFPPDTRSRIAEAVSRAGTWVDVPEPLRELLEAAEAKQARPWQPSA